MRLYHLMVMELVLLQLVCILTLYNSNVLGSHKLLSRTQLASTHFYTYDQRYI